MSSTMHLVGDALHSIQSGLSPQGIFGLVAAGFVVLLAFWLRSHSIDRGDQTFDDADHVIAIHGHTLHYTPPGGAASCTLDLHFLTRVAVETNDLGPFECDLFIILEGQTADGKESRLLLPEGCSGMEHLHEYLFSLPGFRHELWTAAMASTSGQIFDVWISPESHNPDPTNPA